METNIERSFAGSAPLRAKAYQHFRFLILYGCLLLLPGFLHSQNLEEFKKFAEYEGVDCIPYKEMRIEATSIAGEVDKRKEEVKSLGYDKLQTDKNRNLKDIRKKEEEIKGFVKELEDFKQKYPSGFDTKWHDEQIASRTKEIEELQKNTGELNKTLKQGVDSYDRLNQARGGLRDYFDKVLRQLSDSKSNPEKHLGSYASDEDKRRLEEYINNITRKIEEGKSGHKTAEDEALKAKENFQKLLDRTEPES